MVIFSLEGSRIDVGLHSMGKFSMTTEGDVNNLDICLTNVVLGDASATPLLYEVSLEMDFTSHST